MSCFMLLQSSDPFAEVRFISVPVFVYILEYLLMNAIQNYIYDFDGIKNAILILELI